MKKILSFAQKGLIFNNKGEILLIKYSSSKYLSRKLNGKLALPGGQVNFGEDLDTSFVREVFEETGAEITPGIPFYSWTWTYKKDKDLKQIIAVAKLGKFLIGKSIGEIDEGETVIKGTYWIKISDLNVKYLVEDERPVINEYLKYKEWNPFNSFL